MTFLYRSGTDAGRKGSGGSLGDSSGSRKSSSSSSGAAGSRKNSDDTPYHGRNLGSRKGSRELLQDGGTDRKSSRDNLDDNLSGRKGSGANAGRKGSQDSSRKGSRGSGNFDQDDLNDPSRKGSRDHRLNREIFPTRVLYVRLFLFSIKIYVIYLKLVSA